MDDEIPLHTLEFIERHFFHEYDSAYRRYHQEDLPVYDEVAAYQQALEAVTRIRKEREREMRRKQAAAADLAEGLRDDVE